MSSFAARLPVCVEGSIMNITHAMDANLPMTAVAPTQKCSDMCQPHALTTLKSLMLAMWLACGHVIIWWRVCNSVVALSWYCPNRVQPIKVAVYCCSDVIDFSPWKSYSVGYAAIWANPDWTDFSNRNYCCPLCTFDAFSSEVPASGKNSRLYV